MADKLTDAERLNLFDKWSALQEEIISLSQAQIVLVRMKHPKAAIAEPVLEEAAGMKRYEADSLMAELNADRDRVV